MILASREDIAEQLWLRGEPELARAVLDVDDATHRHIMEVAARPTTGRFLHNRVDQLLTAAAVQVLTGTSRAPRRWRAAREESLAEFWAEVGRDRDRRTESGPIELLLRELDQG